MAVAIACSVGLYIHVHKPKWSIVTDPQGNYGYVSYDGEVEGGFKTCEGVKAARDAKRKWSDEYDAQWSKTHWNPFYYKKADCK